jgi:serine/threonine protein kinase
MSPQILERLPYTTKADIWSLGTIFFQMLYGILPWQTNSNSNQTFDQIHKIKT